MRCTAGHPGNRPTGRTAPPFRLQLLHPRARRHGPPPPPPSVLRHYRIASTSAVACRVGGVTSRGDGGGGSTTSGRITKPIVSHNAPMSSATRSQDHQRIAYPFPATAQPRWLLAYGVRGRGWGESHSHRRAGERCTFGTCCAARHRAARIVCETSNGRISDQTQGMIVSLPSLPTSSCCAGAAPQRYPAASPRPRRCR